MAKSDLLLLFFVSLALYLLGNWALAVTDPVECNYALTASEMVAANDWLSPRIYGNYWYDKPIFFYLELIAAFSVFGESDFAARFFPAVFSMLGLFLCYGFGTRLYGRRVGLTAALLMATSLEYWYVGHAIITDMTLFVFMSASLICFYLAYSEERPAFLYPAFFAAALAVLTKGPLGLCLPGLIIVLFLLWERNLRFLFSRHVALGFVLFLAVCSLWYLPMYLKHGSDFITTFFGLHNYLRATVSEHPRDNVWYYYTLIFVAGFLPWSLIGAKAFFHKIKELIRERHLPLPAASRERFLVVWALIVFMVFNAFATKYVTYTLPYMLPLALLMALHFAEHFESFLKKAAASGVVFIALLFLVASPLMEEHSGRPLVEMYETHARSGEAVYGFGRKPSTSFTYYSKRGLPELTSEERIEERAAEGGWALTDVTPKRAIEGVSPAESFLILVREDQAQDMKEQIGGSFTLLETRGKTALYRRNAADFIN